MNWPVVTYQSSEDPKGEITIQWEKSHQPGDPQTGVRIESVGGSTKIIPVSDKQSRVIYTYLGDLGADFNETVRDYAWKKEPIKYFEAVRETLKKRTAKKYPSSDSP